MKLYHAIFSLDGMTYSDDVYAADCIEARALIMENYPNAKSVCVGFVKENV